MQQTNFLEEELYTQDAAVFAGRRGIPITEGRIRYHGDNVLIHVPLDIGS